MKIFGTKKSSKDDKKKNNDAEVFEVKTENNKEEFHNDDFDFEIEIFDTEDNEKEQNLLEEENKSVELCNKDNNIKDDNSDDNSDDNEYCNEHEILGMYTIDESVELEITKENENVIKEGQQLDFEEFEYEKDEYEESKDRYSLKDGLIGKVIKLIDKKSETVESLTEVEKIDTELDILWDQSKVGLINYIRECGLNINQLETSIDILQNKLIWLEETDNCRVVIVDSGTGNFVSTTMRRKIADLIISCADNIKVTVFYTDYALKYDIEVNLKDARVKRDIDWKKYINTTVTVAELMKYNENYVYIDKKDDDELELKDSELNYKGLPLIITEDSNKIKGQIFNSSIDDLIVDVANKSFKTEFNTELDPNREIYKPKKRKKGEEDESEDLYDSSITDEAYGSNYNMKLKSFEPHI